MKENISKFYPPEINLSRIVNKIEILEERIEKIEEKINSIYEILQIFNSNSKFKKSSIILAFLAGGVANMIGLYTIIKTFISIIVKIK
jgi:Tfp pilus assembly PilM family ATPase